MSHRYQIWFGDRLAEIRDAPNAHAALIHHARSLGYYDDELMRLGDDAVSWRGSVFHAVEVDDAEGEGDQGQAGRHSTSGAATQVGAGAS